MDLRALLERRRSIRYYTGEKIDPEVIADGLRLAQLAPSSSNMQLYEFYHVVDEHKKAELATACLSQNAASTAEQFVVFVTRQDLHRERAREVIEFEVGNIARTSPPERQEPRTKARSSYYNVLMPIMYTRFFGVLGLLRKALTSTISLFRPMITTTTEADMRVVLHKSAGLAAQTFMLAMAERDVDTCPMEGFDERRVRKVLGLPRSAEINMVISCGKKLEERGVWGERFRVPFERVYRRL